MFATKDAFIDSQAYHTLGVMNHIHNVDKELENRREKRGFQGICRAFDNIRGFVTILFRTCATGLAFSLASLPCFLNL